MPLSGTTVGFICVGALLAAAIFAAILDRKEKAKGDAKKSKSLSRAALVLFIAAFVGGVAVTLAGGIHPREEGQTMTGKPMSGVPPPMSSIGKVDDAEIEALKKRLDKNPKDVAALERMGHLALQLQDFESVFTLAHRALLIDPKSAESLAHMGMVAFANRDKEKALQQFDLALKADPKLTEALLFKGIVQFQSDDWKGAKETFERFLKLAKPDDPGRVRVEMFLRTVNEQLGTK